MDLFVDLVILMSTLFGVATAILLYYNFKIKEEAFEHIKSLSEGINVLIDKNIELVKMNNHLTRHTKWVGQYNSYSCLGAAVAMAVGCGLDDFTKYVGHNGSNIIPESNHPEGREGFGYIEVFKFLLSNNMAIGSPIISCGGDSTKPVKYKDFIDGDTIKTVISLSTPAIVIVQATHLHKDGTHAIYWSGEQAYCPRRGEIDLKEHNIVAWIPIYNV